MAICISIILRAVALAFLSSFSNASRTWQNSHSTPSEALMNCIAGCTLSAGTPFITWMFLKNCSAVFPACVGGAAFCARARFIASGREQAMAIRMIARTNVLFMGHLWSEDEERGSVNDPCPEMKLFNEM